jgi:hypothetical protein
MLRGNMISYLELAISIAAGAAGYLIVTFWAKPIIRYKDLKHQLVVDLIYYANAIEPSGMNDFIQDLHKKRVLALRRHSAEFVACFLNLPLWYQGFLEIDEEEPMNAAPQLMGLSNTRDYEQAARRIELIEKYLRIKIPGI